MLFFIYHYCYLWVQDCPVQAPVHLMGCTVMIYYLLFSIYKLLITVAGIEIQGQTVREGTAWSTAFWLSTRLPRAVLLVNLGEQVTADARSRS